MNTMNVGEEQRVRRYLGILNNPAAGQDSRRRAAKAIGNRRSEAAAIALLSVLEGSSDALCREYAALALIPASTDESREWDNPTRFIFPLKSLLNDKSRGARYAAAQALKGLGEVGLEALV